MTNEIIFRSAKDKDWETYKQIRLAALQDAPDAFSNSYEIESKSTDDKWKRFLDSGSRFFIAFDSSKPVGLIGFFTKTDQPTSRYIFSMWVDPKYRDKSVGTTLVHKVIKNAEVENIQHLITGYATSNPRARSFYEKLGFVESGVIKPLKRDPNIKEIEMTMQISSKRQEN